MSRLFNSLGVTQERVLHRYIPKVPSQCHCNPATGLLSFSWNKYLKHSGNALDVIVELRSKKKKKQWERECHHSRLYIRGSWIITGSLSLLPLVLFLRYIPCSVSILYWFQYYVHTHTYTRKLEPLQLHSLDIFYIQLRFRGAPQTKYNNAFLVCKAQIVLILKHKAHEFDPMPQICISSFGQWCKEEYSCLNVLSFRA